MTFGWEQFDHPLYSPHLAPSAFHMFLYLKTFLGDQQFHDDNKVKEAVNTWSASQVASFYDGHIKTSAPLQVHNGGNYVEK
jgi:hypothetical protein